jgi:transcriptional regulator with PAS, ATPase and Fis domain
VPNSNAFAGVLVSGGVTLKRFELSTCPSGFDYGRTLPPAFRVQVNALPHRCFDLSPVTFEDWAGRDVPAIVEALLFRDVTELARVEQDRDELDRKYRIVKQKEYFGFVGGNERILELLEQVDRFADSGGTVLVEGPTGAGKEVLARAIHARSNRRDRPFVKVDCASLPQTLLESELFGHEKGAFTGAVSRVQGRFESADKGTLFLDEIGNIDLSMQAKLLGFLEDHTFTPLGGRQPIRVDVRIIAATNAPLEKRVGEGSFREDLFYRLKVFNIRLPALRERLDDLPLLVDSFIRSINERHGTSVQGVAPAVMDRLLTHAWPGNVRELHNLLLSLSVQKKKGVIDRLPEFAVPRGKKAAALPPERLRLDSLLEFAKARGYFSIRECREEMAGSLATVRRDLAKLVKKDRLRLEGKGPGARYFFKQA